jgi:hypothetical protein
MKPEGGKMTRHRVIGGALIVLFLNVASLHAPSGGAAAKTTDQSDLWWIPAESGWGIQFVEEETTIFATMFVYGPDGKPTWYVATMGYLGSFTWSGTLYATTGPWFGAVPFDPSTVTVTAVGNMTLSAPFINQAVLTYTVNGVPVVKQIQRQTLVFQNFSGQYAGTMSIQGTGLACDPSGNTNATPVSVQVTHNAEAITIATQTGTDSCTFSGTYTQGGHFGHVSGGYVCTSGDTGTFTFFEMAISWYDFRARTLVNSNTGCTLKGYLDGLTQPPPLQ